MTSLTTPWCRAVGIEVPLVCAPMGGAAGGRLAAAVSTAGGLGMIGMGSSATAAGLRDELTEIGSLERPFGIGLVHWVMAADPEMLEVALAARPAVLSVSFGDDWRWVSTVHEAGVPVVTQVATVDAALRAVDAGVDVLVARGAEGGGHGEPTVGTLPLLAEVLDSVDAPVLAAGGIASARAVAAVLAAGASAVWMGTALAVCVESLTLPAAREALLNAGSDSTDTTREFDIAAGYRWPASIPERVLRDDSGNLTPVNAGQGVGSVTTSEPAAEFVRRIFGGAETLLRAWSG